MGSKVENDDIDCCHSLKPRFGGVFLWPGWLVRLGAATLIDTDPELPRYGRNVVPARLLSEGYSFKYGRLEDAIQSLK